MTYEQVMDAVGKLTFGWPLKAWNMRVEAWPDAYSVERPPSMVLRICAEAPNAIDPAGKPIPLVVSDYLPLHRLGSPERVWAEIRRLAQALILHELDESMMADGQRRWDPHAVVRTGDTSVT